jgi:hypothetical protein
MDFKESLMLEVRSQETVLNVRLTANAIECLRAIIIHEELLCAC